MVSFFKTMLNYSDVYPKPIYSNFRKVNKENVCIHRKYNFNYIKHADTILFADVHLFKNFSILK